MLEQVLATVLKFSMFRQGDKVLVGVSGGADSVALFHILFRLREKFNLELFICHLNHMFRGEEARADAGWVASLARKFDIPSIIEDIDVPGYMIRHNLPAQVAARQVRYRFYRRVAAEKGCSRVALGHHADDQAETILINLLRGAGTSGLKGIPPVRENFFVRPLIEARRKQIEAYCLLQELSYRQDSSNLKPVYTRNRVRMELIPLLEKEYNPAVVASLNRLAGIMREENDFMEAAAENALERIVGRVGPGEVRLSLKSLTDISPALLRRILRMIFRRMAGESRAPDYEQIEKALALLKGALPGKLEWPSGILLIKRYGQLEIIKGGAGENVPCYRYPLNIPGETRIPETGICIESEIMDISVAPDPMTLHSGEALLDYAKLTGPVEVRRRRDGDLFWPLGFKGTIKLKKFFIDKKIPREKRDFIPLVTAGEEIAWAAGRPGEKWKITRETKKCLYLKIVSK